MVSNDSEIHPNVGFRAYLNPDLDLCFSGTHTSEEELKHVMDTSKKGFNAIMRDYRRSGQNVPGLHEFPHFRGCDINNKRSEKAVAAGFIFGVGALNEYAQLLSMIARSVDASGEEDFKGGIGDYGWSSRDSGSAEKSRRVSIGSRSNSGLENDLSGP